MRQLPKYISNAIVCGSKQLDIYSWRKKKISTLSIGEKVLRFASDYLVFPEGVKRGEPLVLDPFQCAFILDAFREEPCHVGKGIFSVGRRNGKTLLMAVILLAYIIGPLARENTLIRSAAMSRDQAGLLYRLMALILLNSPRVSSFFSVTDSSKRIIGLRRNVEYRSLSREAKTGFGQGIYVLVIDECGQIESQTDEFLDMLSSSMGTYEDARTFLISTQAPSDAAFLSLEIDSCIRDQPEDVVCHLYTAPTDEIKDKKNWEAANPGIAGGYRSLNDVKRQSGEALRIPSKQNGFLNLILNRRVTLQTAFLAPAVYRECSGEPDFDVFRTKPVSLGLDLSARTDLTAAVIAAEDDNRVVHLYPFVFCPTVGIEERGQRDRVPYAQWVKDGYLIPLGGSSMDYDQICEYLRNALYDLDIHIQNIVFDRWGITTFRKAAENQEFALEAEYVPCGQGYKDMSPRCKAFEVLTLKKRVRHGNHPLFNMAFSHAVVETDPSGNIKIAKNKSIQRIDPAVAAIMAAYQVSEGNVTPSFDVAALIA